MGRLVTTVHTVWEPSDEDWAEYMSGVHDFLPLEGQRILVLSAGGGPNSTQRKAMTDALDGAKVPVAILTNSWVMRGAATAVSWFNPNLRVFGPTAMEAAFEHLELTPWERAESSRVIQELQKSLGIQVTDSADVA